MKWLGGLVDGETHLGTLGTLGVTQGGKGPLGLEEILDTLVGRTTQDEDGIIKEVARVTLEGALGATLEGDLGVLAMAKIRIRALEAQGREAQDQTPHMEGVDQDHLAHHQDLVVVNHPMGILVAQTPGGMTQMDIEVETKR